MIDYREFGKKLGLGFGKKLSSISAAFDPATLTSLVIWVKSDAGLFTATDEATPAENADDPVGRWKDQSGSGNHLDQATAGFKPLLKINQINGYNAVLGDGVDDRLANLGLIGAQPWSFHVVYNVADAAAPGSPQNVVSFLWHGGASLGYFNATNKHVFSSDGANNLEADEVGDQWTYAVGIGNGASSELRVRGASTTGSIGTATGDDLSLFASRVGNNPALAYIAEFALQTAVATAEEISGMESYFISRYGF